MDLIKIHPIFDPTDGVWFVGGVTAKSIRELIVKIEKKRGVPVICKDYYPAGTEMPPVKYPATTAEEFLKRTERPSPAPSTNFKSQPSRREKKTRKYANNIVSPPMERDATDEERSRFSALENQILDMWGAGKPAPEIAKELSLTDRETVGKIAAKGRSKGDPRAVKRFTRPAK
jgi:DNA-binding CsgD family transcriptional regulator